MPSVEVPCLANWRCNLSGSAPSRRELGKCKDAGSGSKNSRGFMIESYHNGDFSASRIPANAASRACSCAYPSPRRLVRQPMGLGGIIVASQRAAFRPTVAELRASQRLGRVFKDAAQAPGFGEHWCGLQLVRRCHSWCRDYRSGAANGQASWARFCKKNRPTEARAESCLVHVLKPGSAIEGHASWGSSARKTITTLLGAFP
jgi:hypothetical protein